VPDSEVPDFCDTIALQLRKSPRSRRYLSSAQGQIRRQNQLESGQLPKSPSEVKSIDCTETASNLTQTVVIRLQLSVSGISDECRRLCVGEYPMNSSSADFSTILDRILDTAADNLRIAKILVQMGLDPNNITYDALFNRLLEIVLTNITLANMFALVGAIFLVATLLMHTMVPLRVANMAGCMFFVAYGALSGNVGAFILYLLLLPINAIRLRQMLNLIKRARIATEGDTSLEWLKPFMTEHRYRRGDKLFKKDDAASEMFLTVTGTFLVREIGVELPPGRLMGELGFLTPNQRRTATVECIEDGQVMTITYERLLEIYFQNPQFGYYFLVLTSQRLLENISRLDGIIAQERAARLQG
jgi:Cyclic nucleotide-binding domain